MPELIVIVLQSQVCELYFVDDLFSDLRIERYPKKSRLSRHFLIVVVLARSKPIIVEIHEDKFALEPGFDLRLRFAIVRSFIRFIVALFESQD